MVEADFSGNFTNEDNCNDGDIGVVVGEGINEDKKTQAGKPYRQLSIEVEVNGKRLIHSPRMGEGRVLVKAWGKDTKDWVGKGFIVSHIKIESFGKKKTVVEIEPLDEKV